jgi:hypothetical protein
MKKPNVQWLENSQLDYFNTAANVLGYSNIPLAWGLSLVSWKSKDDLNTFLDHLVYAPGNRGQGAA